MKSADNFERIKRELMMLEPITSAITLDMNINEVFISLIKAKKPIVGATFRRLSGRITTSAQKSELM